MLLALVLGQAQPTGLVEPEHGPRGERVQVLAALEGPRHGLVRRDVRGRPHLHRGPVGRNEDVARPRHEQRPKARQPLDRLGVGNVLHVRLAAGAAAGDRAADPVGGVDAAGHRRDLRRQALAIGAELLLDPADVDQRLEQRIGGRARGEVGPPGAELSALRRPRPVLLLLLL